MNSIKLFPRWMLMIIHRLEADHDMSAADVIKTANQIAAICGIMYIIKEDKYIVFTNKYGKKGKYVLAGKDLTIAENYFLTHKKERVSYR